MAFYRYIHRPGCGGVAFEINHLPMPGEAARSSDIILEDGSSPETGEVALCQQCGCTIKTLSSSNCELSEMNEQEPGEWY